MGLRNKLRSHFPGVLVGDAYDYLYLQPHREVKFFISKDQIASSNDFYIWTSKMYTGELVRLMKSVKKVYNPVNEGSPLLFVDGTSKFFDQDLTILENWIRNLKSKVTKKID